MSDKKHVKIVVDGFKNETSDNDILRQLYDAGVDFNDMRTVFNEIIKEKGLRLSTKDRKIKTSELMEGTESIADHEVALTLVAMLQDKLKVTSTKALGSLRAWCKDNGIDMPKMQKAKKARKPGFGGKYKVILEHVLQNREIDKEGMKEFCHSQDIPEAYGTQAMNVIHFAKLWSGEIVEEVEAPAEVEAEAEAA